MKPPVLSPLNLSENQSGDSQEHSAAKAGEYPAYAYIVLKDPEI